MAPCGSGSELGGGDEGCVGGKGRGGEGADGGASGGLETGGCGGERGMHGAQSTQSALYAHIGNSEPGLSQ